MELNFSFELGVPQGKREDLFGLFNRVHSNPNVQGIGIALEHCKKIVELHQGKT
jgi:light-regulated signal transduction histidine kinase (bacteriophytochrome)